MLPGIVGLTRLLGVPDECVRVLNQDAVHAYLFRTGPRYVALVWTADDRARPLKLRNRVSAYDVMGNLLPVRDVRLSDSPLYLVGGQAETLMQSLGQ